MPNLEGKKWRLKTINKGIINGKGKKIDGKSFKAGRILLTRNYDGKETETLNLFFFSFRFFLVVNLIMFGSKITLLSGGARILS